MKFLAKMYRSLVVYLNGGINRLSSFFYKRLMISCGKNVRFSARTSDFTYSNISIGNDVYIGPKALFVATESKIFIGNKVMFGPGVTLIGGDHNISVVGRFMYDVKEKRPEDDQDIRIEDDVWVAANVTILKGVTIGRGAVVAAGALVNHDIPPYAIAVGVPAKVLKYRWDLDTTIKHEESLYDTSARLNMDELKRNRYEG